MVDFDVVLPDVGEGLSEAEITKYFVKIGDYVEMDQLLVEIETAKSLVELPSPVAGIVSSINFSVGDVVEVGKVLLRVEIESDDRNSVKDKAGFPSVKMESLSKSSIATPLNTENTEISREQSSDNKKTPVLVGYGTAGISSSKRAAARKNRKVIDGNITKISSIPVLAKPPIRKLAKDLGVDVTNIRGSGVAGEILREDVLSKAEQAKVFKNIDSPNIVSGREEIIPVKGVRKAIAKAMVKSAFEAPHVSVFVDVDATRTMEYVKRLKNSTDFVGIKISPTLIMAKAIIWAVRRNPSVNSYWGDKEIIIRNYVNLGIAAATPRGLIVPNIKDSQKMTLKELAISLDKLTVNARENKTTPEDMSNGTITLTNIGVFGMDTGTPILNPGEVAIVALGTIKMKPWVVDGEVRARMVTTIGASFDHRVVDGDVASRFVADVASVIEEPALLLD